MKNIPYEVTYRVRTVDDLATDDKSAATTPELAKFAARYINRLNCLVLEHTKWRLKGGKFEPVLTAIDDVEQYPGQWRLRV